MQAVTTRSGYFRANVQDEHFEYIPAFVPKDAGGVQPLDPPACDVVGGNQAIDVQGSAWTLTTQPPAPMHDRRAR